MDKDTEYVVALCTVPSVEVGSTIARRIVEEKLAACANIVDRIRSIYYWNGTVCDDAEALLVIKTRRRTVGELTRRILALHPYETPEVIALPIVAGHEGYLSWISASLDRS